LKGRWVVNRSRSIRRSPLKLFKIR
jgi:hypothetical protein